MTGNPCNCENDCPNYIKKGEWCKVLGIVVGENRRWLMSRAGCMLHPLAREYLMRGVIEGLQCIVSEVDSANDWETSLKQIREKAIALIKGERK